MRPRSLLHDLHLTVSELGAPQPVSVHLERNTVSTLALEPGRVLIPRRGRTNHDLTDNTRHGLGSPRSATVVQRLFRRILDHRLRKSHLVLGFDRLTNSGRDLLNSC